MDREALTHLAPVNGNTFSERPFHSQLSCQEIIVVKRRVDSFRKPLPRNVHVVPRSPVSPAAGQQRR